MKLITSSVLLVLAPIAQAATCTSEPWSESTQYKSNETVSHSQSEYSAKWWNKGEEPNKNDQWGAWEWTGDCIISTPEDAPKEESLMTTLQPDTAVLDGASISSDGSIDLQKGTAKWTLSLPEDGSYTITFDYYSPYGDKTNTFYIGSHSSSQTTPQSNTTESLTFEFELNAGSIELGIDGSNGNWGYIFIEQVHIEGHQSTIPPIDPEPPVDTDYPGTHVTDSTRDNYSDFTDTIENVAPEHYIGQEEQTRIIGSHGNIYSKELYDTGYGEDVGIAWAGWNPQHYLGNKAHKMAVIDEYNIKRLSFIPTYFIASYTEGVRCNDSQNTLTAAQQVDLLTELVNKGVRINYRPHIDPIKFSWEGSSANQNPGDLDWRGLFDQLDPMGDDYKCVIDQGLQIIKQVIENAGSNLKEPVRFDLGAELMSSTKIFPHKWGQLAQHVRLKVEEDTALKNNVILGHNFSHHVQYLMEIEDHSEYFSRIVSGGSFENYPNLLFVDDMTSTQRQDLADYIKALDVVTVSQYMPMDVITPIVDNTVVDIATTPTDVKDALLIHEQNFVQKVLMGKLGIKKEELPSFHLGEYGMGIKGLITPNVWDSSAVSADEKISYEVHQKHAEVAIKGLLEYMQAPETMSKSLIIWVSGAPYDVISFYKGDGQGMDTGDAGHGYPGMPPFNQEAADSLKNYWNN